MRRSREPRRGVLRVAPPRRRRAVTRSSTASTKAGTSTRRSSSPRYGAVYAFFLDGLAPASERLKNFVDKAAQATLVGDVFDDAATGQGLLNYFLRGIACGAVTEDEALATGLSLDEIRSKSFVKIMAARTCTSQPETAHSQSVIG